MGVPPNGWVIMENTCRLDDDWGYPYFRKPSYIYIYIYYICIYTVKNADFPVRYVKLQEASSLRRTSVFWGGATTGVFFLEAVWPWGSAVRGLLATIIKVIDSKISHI